MSSNKVKEVALYKTEKCRNWDERGTCRYGRRCRYAHGDRELRPIYRSVQYKTKTCKAYHELGTCPYGIRCTFIHDINDKPQIESSSVSSTASNNHDDWEPILFSLNHSYELLLYHEVPFI
ncbi:hypothetical protein EDC94DRAFT_543313 [Helicostylum pulchrum]|nr:hypothetical protein EDC94DRAFT_543313 [Helicostylum pulchrum]